MDSRGLLLLGAFACAVIVGANGQCSFPGDWYSDPVQYYFDGYDQNDAYKLSYFNDTWYFVPTSGGMYRCEADGVSAGEFRVSAFLNYKNDKRYCFEAKLSDQVLFTRTTAEVDLNAAYSIARCKELLGDRKMYKALIKFPFAANNFDGVTSPLASIAGTYQFAFTRFDAEGRPLAEQCTDNTGSTVTISGNMCEFSSSCLASVPQNYTNPFNGKLYVVGGQSDSQLSIGQGASDSGMVILSYSVGTPTVTRFYIARYSVKDGRLNMMFSTKDRRDPTGYVDISSVPDQEKPNIIISSFKSDECKDVVCENGGQCSQQWKGFTCDCAAGYEGVTCQTNTDDCNPNPCQNGGVCTDGVNTFTCACTASWSGRICDFADACANDPCENGGTCSTVASGRFKCECPASYSGVKCEVENTCITQQPCENGATCFFNLGGYICQCPAGFTGPTCADDICEGDPCGEGATCTRDGCQCPEERWGDRCQFPPTSGCGSINPCQNGGLCIPTTQGFRCDCDIYYEGDICQDLSDWFIVALVLICLLALILFVLLIVCCCYVCCGWRPGVRNSAYDTMHDSSASSFKADTSPGTVQFNFNPPNKYMGIKVVDRS